MKKIKRSVWLTTLTIIGMMTFFVGCQAKDTEKIGDTDTTFSESNHSAIVKTEFICVNPPTLELHSSTIEETPHGLIASWFGGTKEKNPDVGIWVSRKDHGKEWTQPIEVANGIQGVINGVVERYPCWNPVLYQQANGPLLLFYKVGPTTPEWWGMMMSSEDGGRTWTEPVRLPDDIYGPIKNKPVQIGENGILSPSSIKSMLHFERSDDVGKTWKRTPAVTDRSIPVIQPSILFHGGEKLQSVGRTLGARRVFSIWSNDDGETWNNFKLLDLPNPNSGTDALTLADGRQLLVYNHSTVSRSPLNVAISNDGIEWHPLLVLEYDKEGGYSYPAVIQGKDGLVHITYSWRRKNIKHVVIDPSKIQGEPILSWHFQAKDVTGAEQTSTSTYNKKYVKKSILFRGKGVKTEKATYSFASSFPINKTQEEAESAQAYYQFAIQAEKGHKLSLSSIGVVLRVQSDAPKIAQWQYSTDGGNTFKNIGKSYTIKSVSTGNNGMMQPQVELFGINELQSISSSKEIVFRLYAWGGVSDTSNNGFRIGKSDELTDALVVNGFIE